MAGQLSMWYIRENHRRVFNSFLTQLHCSAVWYIYTTHMWRSICSCWLLLTALEWVYSVYISPSTSFMQPNRPRLRYVKCTNQFILFFCSIGIIMKSNLQIFTIWVLLIFNVGALGILLVFTYLFSTGERRVKIVGWSCSTFSICVFAAPLSIMVIHQLPN